jgi:heme-degrading monooxygenase HmoA
MATVMTMHWPEVTKEKYEQVRSDVKWETDVPNGAKFHVAWWADDGFHVLDLWDSAGAFQDFVQNRLMAATQRAGLTTQPSVELSEAHAIFAPNV